MGATRASLITYVNPCVAVILGLLVLGEAVTLATLAGFALIVVGCWLSAGPRQSHEPAARDELLEGSLGAGTALSAR